MVLTLLSLFTLTQCNTGELDFEDIKLPNYEGRHYLPLGSTTFTASELLEDLEDDKLDIDTTQAGILTLVYRDTAEFSDLDEVIVIDDVSNDGLIESPQEVINSPVEVTLPLNQGLSFEYPISDGEELDSIIYRAGTISISFESDFDVPLDFEMVIDDITDINTGDTLRLSGSVGSNGSGSSSASLANHRTIATRNDLNQNIFTGTFNGTLYIEEGSSVFLTDEFRYRIDIEGVEFQTIYGYFGTKTFDIQSQQIEMDFFDQIEGDLNFGDPQISLLISNGFGVTMGLELSNISASNSNGESLALSGAITEELQFINAPDVNSVGSSRSSIIRINNENSNIADLLNLGPNLFDISVAAELNYTDRGSVVPEEDRNFVDINSTATTIMELEIPLDLQLTSLSRTIDYSLDDFDFDDADSLNLRLKTINRLPLNGDIDLQILDADSAVVHEIPNVSVFSSPVVPVGSKINEGAESVDYIKLYGEGLEAITTQPTIRLVINVNSYDADNDTFVKIYADYNLEVNLGIEATLNLELE
ncbi:hypothetical protein [Reichenbachiella ulvae]|uniref:Uncharacterized protein n=1 Tax=Reichenbachiella ulvae TaxID=2980104 RepID=A0ABT3CWW3_9BACT|nr:hypothetical protein [Reichenbachiella ulvae]MCV9387975.1 hypothetical protein [Reichenbachiella ulvae]